MTALKIVIAGAVLLALGGCIVDPYGGPSYYGGGAPAYYTGAPAYYGGPGYVAPEVGIGVELGGGREGRGGDRR